MAESRMVYTVKELIDHLSLFPEDAEVYLEYGHNAMSRHPRPLYTAARRSAYGYTLPAYLYSKPTEDEGMVVFL